MRAYKSFVGLSLILQYPLQLCQQLVHVLCNVVRSCGMLLSKIIGRLPLVDVVLSVGVVEAVVVVVDSFAYFQVSEADAPGQTSEVIDSDVAAPEEIEDQVSVWVWDGQDFVFGEAGVVGAVADGARVVVAVEPVEEHDMSNKIIIQLLTEFQYSPSLLKTQTFSILFHHILHFRPPFSYLIEL